MRVVTRITCRLTALSAVMLLAAASGCGMESKGGASNNDNHYPDGGTADGGGCQVALTHSPPSPRVGERITVNADVLSGTPIDYQWTVDDPNGAPLTFDVRNDGRTIEFVPSDPGTHDVEVQVGIAGGGYCSPGHRSITVAAPDARIETHTAVLTPADLSQAPRQKRNLQVIGHTPQSDLAFQLDPGTQVFVELEGPDGPLDGYVRLTPVGSSLHLEGFYSVQQSALEFRLFDMATYDVLVVPDTDSVAPEAIRGLTVAEVADPATFVLTRGEVVGGEVKANFTGLADTRVVLRCNDVPSSVGITIPTGDFGVYARPGACSVSVVPPEGSQWPELGVPDTAGVEVVAGTNLSLAFAYRALAFRNLSGQVFDTDGTTPVDSARITLTSQPLSDLADLTVTGDGTPVGPLPVSGVWRGSVLADGSGNYDFSPIPAGVYRAVIEPPTGQATVIDGIDLTAGDLISHPLVLAVPARLFGTVMGEPATEGAPNEPAAGVRVVARTDLGTGSAVETVTDEEGLFELSVVSGATYSLRFVPDTNAGLAWLVGISVAVQGDTQVLDMNNEDPVLARGLQLEGMVTGPGSGGGVLLQVFCQGCDLTNPLAETYTDAASSFILVVPDPGLEEVTP